MSYSSLAALASDGDFRQRVSACAAEQETQTSADLGGLHPTGWADANLWQIAASPGFAAAYQYALDTGIERPGSNPAVITDAQILAAVQLRLGPMPIGEVATPLLAVIEGDAADHWITVQDRSTGLGYRLIAVPAT